MVYCYVFSQIECSPCHLLPKSHRPHSKTYSTICHGTLRGVPPSSCWSLQSVVIPIFQGRRVNCMPMPLDVVPKKCWSVPFQHLLETHLPQPSDYLMLKIHQLAGHLPSRGSFLDDLYFQNRFLLVYIICLISDPSSFGDISSSHGASAENCPKDPSTAACLTSPAFLALVYLYSDGPIPAAT